MNRDQLQSFMAKHGLSAEQLADLIGLTKSAVDHWLNGIRSIAKPYGRLMRLFDKHPELMRDFK